jgi:hypothetical protein
MVKQRSTKYILIGIGADYGYDPNIEINGMITAGIPFTE